jgi:hypothetical protein
MTFFELAERVLGEEKKPLTANEIWQIGKVKGYDKQLNSEGKTPWATLGAQIYVSARDNPKSPFAQTDSRPKKFYLKSQALLPSKLLHKDNSPFAIKQGRIRAMGSS